MSRLGLLALVAAFLGCQTAPSTLEVVERVDLDRYLGRWYELASFPQYFQRGCVATQAHYSRREDGRIRVENQCRDGTLDGEVRRAEGVAWVDEGDASNARLRVQFFWPFWGDYWIIDLDPGYRWAVVGHPERKYLWILSRTPTLDEAVYQEVLARIREKGYDLAPLKRTLQPPS
jgi:apolipoprotein D and lipocalin family protein